MMNKARTLVIFLSASALLPLSQSNAVAEEDTDSNAGFLQLLGHLVQQECEEAWSGSMADRYYCKAIEGPEAIGYENGVICKVNMSCEAICRSHEEYCSYSVHRWNQDWQGSANDMRKLNACKRFGRWRVYTDC